MPLKEPDLKDADSYKKASRRHLSEVASGKVKFWIYKDVELGSAKKQKYPAFLALVADDAIRKAMTGKQLICKGTCSMKDDRIAFEPSSGKVPYNLLKTSIPQLLGNAVWIPNGTEESGDEKEAAQQVVASAAPVSPQAPAAPATPPSRPQAAAPPTPPPKAAAAALTGAWAKLVKDVQAFAAAHPERKADLFRDMSAIAALLKADKAEEAKPKMDQVQAALTAPPPAAAEAVKPGAPQLLARWNNLVKRLQAAAAANPQKKAEFTRAGAGIQEAFRARRFDQAAKLIDELETMLTAKPAAEEEAKEKETPEEKKKAEAKEPEEDEDAEDEEEQKEAEAIRKNLKGRMVSAMAQVRTRAPKPGDPKPKPQMRFMVYIAGNATSVIVANKVGAGNKKLLIELAGAAGGKIAQGECIFENGVHTFVFATVPSGIAKKLTAALLAETGTRYRVRVRAIDGSVDLDSETDVAETDVDSDATSAAGSDEMAKFEARLTALRPEIKAKPQIKAAPGAKDEKGLNVLASDAAYFAKSNDFAKANQLLDRVESLLKSAALQKATFSKSGLRPRRPGRWPATTWTHRSRNCSKRCAHPATRNSRESPSSVSTV